MLTKIVTLAQKFLRQELIEYIARFPIAKRLSLHSKTGYVNRIYVHPHCS